MTGFHFHLRCGACGLTSNTEYPDRYGPLYLPAHLHLPAVSRATGTFDHAIIPIAEPHLSLDETLALAAQHSTADVTVCVKVRRRGVVLEPPVPCPRCGEDRIEAPFGAPPEPRRIATGTDQIIAESRALVDTGRIWHLDDRGVHVGLSVVPEEHGVVHHWSVHRQDGVAPERAQIAAVVAELIAALTALGGTCSEPTAGGAFTSFDERTPR